MPHCCGATPTFKRNVWILLGTLWSFGAIGFVDDYKKLIKKNHKGLASRWKYFWQTVMGLGVACLLYFTAQSAPETTLIAPFFKDFSWPMGLLFIPFVYLVVVGSSNAVNLTDGLDGLASGLMIIASGAMTVLSYVSGHAQFARYLEITRLPGSGELTIYCASLTGACLGFLWYNCHPAEVFMGDVGALAMGGGLGVVAVLLKQELLLPFIGGIFVLEALSVILQVGSYKLRNKKRIFKMAPLHHHFEQLGWSESKIIVRFWIGALVFALFALTTLKLR